MKTSSLILSEPDVWQELVLPVAGRSEALRTQLQVNIKHSLGKVLKEIARVFPETTDDLEDGVYRLDASVRFSPRLYFYYFTLLRSMARSDLDAVSTCRDALRQCLENPYADRFEIRAQMDDIARSVMHAHRTATDSEANVLSDSAIEAEVDRCGQVSHCDAELARRHITELERSLATSDPHLVDEVASLVSVVQLMPRSFSAEAASSLSAFGTVFVRPPLNTYASHARFFYFDRIVHEAAHIYLNMLMTFDPLVTNGTTLAPSPARQTLRPMKGVLHAHFVFFRLLHAYRHAPDTIRQTEVPCPPQARLARMSLSGLPLSFAAREAIYLDKFMTGDSILRSSATFTPCGQRFLDSMMETMCHV